MYWDDDSKFGITKSPTYWTIPEEETEEEKKKKKKDKFMSFESYWGKSIAGESDPQFQATVRKGAKEFGTKVVGKPLETISELLAQLTYFPITRGIKAHIKAAKGEGPGYGPEMWQQRAKEESKFFTAREPVWGSELLEETGMKPGWMKEALGLGMDIGLDPLTYVTGGMGKAGKLSALEKVAKPGSKVAKSIEKLKSAGKFLELGETTAEQIARGQKGMRWMGKPIAPKGQAELYGKVLKPAKEGLKALEEKALGKWHLSKYSGPERMNVIQEIITAEKHGRPEVMEAIGKGFKERKLFTQKLSDKYGANVNEVEQILTQMSELKPPPGTPAFQGVKYSTEETFNPELLGKLTSDKEALNFAKDIKSTMATIGAKEIEAGVLKKGLETDLIDYMTHLITPEGRKVLKGKWGMERLKKKLVDMTHPSTKHRTLLIPADPNDLELLEKLPKMAWKEKKKLLDEGIIKYPAISEINQLAREGTLFPGKEISQFFYEDPAKITAIRQLRSEKALMSARILENARDIGLKEGWAAKWKAASPLDVILGEAEKVGKKPPIPEGFDIVKSPLTQDVVFQKDVADVLNSTYDILNNPQKMAGLVGAYKKTLQWWKIWTLMPFPSYHFRNVFGGNLFNQTLFGMNPIKESWFQIGSKKLGIPEGANLTAGKIQRINKWKNRGLPIEQWGKKARKWADEVLSTETGQKIKLIELDEWAKQDNIYRAGQFTADIFEDTPRFLTENKKTLNPLKTWNTFTTHGMQVGNALEDNAKLGLYIYALRKGYPRQEAAKIAHKFIFDYFDIPKSVEKAKNFMPFITWYYKNIPLQLEYMAKKPYIFHSVYKTRRSITGEKEPKSSVMTPYYKDSYPVVLQKKDGKARWIGLGRWLPVTDVNMLTDWKQLGSMLWPGVKTPIEMMFNKELYFDEPIFSTEEQPVSRRQMFGKYMPNWMAYLLKQHRATSTLDRLNPLGIWGTEKRKGLFGLGEERGGKWEMPEAARWIREATGVRSYETDVKQATDTRINLLERKKAKLKGTLKWQVSQKEIDKIRKEIREIETEIRELKAYKY